MKFNTKLLATLLLFCGFSTLFAQKEISKDPRKLKAGAAYTDQLSKTDIHPFTLEANADQFVYGFVDQQTVDVVVEIFDPEGEKMRTFDGPARGAEHFQFQTETKGTYTLKVSAFKENEGGYSVKLKYVGPIAKEPEAKVDQLLMAFNNKETPGAVVGIYKNGSISFSKAYGMANLVHGLPFALDMPSNIGSVTKQFTAMGILLLEQQGKLSVEDDVRKHIPELPDFGETIRLKNLLNHTNGLREIYNTMPMRGWNGEDNLEKSEAIHMIQRQQELQASPGSEFNYNNTAFIFLAEIIERITEQSFPDYMKANVFEPLGMKSTMVRHNPSQIVPKGTQGYSSGEFGFQEAGDLGAAYGAGAIYTTVDDLGKWLHNFKEPKVGDAALIEKLVTPDVFTNGDTMNYAFGIGVMEYRGLKKYQHTGGDIAHRALLAYYPEIDAGVIVMSNNASFPLGIANAIGEAFLEQYMEPKEENKEEKEVKAGYVEVDEEILETYAGKYKFEGASFTIEYKLEDGQLVAYPMGQESRPIHASNDTTFDYDGIEASIIFHVSENGEVNSATHIQGGKNKLNKLEPYDPSLEDLQAFVGKYYSEELETFYNLEIEEDQLIARHVNMKAIKLEPVEADQFAGSVFFFGEVKFARDAQQQVTGFQVSNGRTSGMAFVRYSNENQPLAKGNE